MPWALAAEKGGGIARPHHLDYNKVMFDQISITEIMKWVTLIFLAGFIGFFGKHLGRKVISLFEGEKEGPPPRVSQPGQAINAEDRDIQIKAVGNGSLRHGGEKDEQKLVKKAMKTEAKSKKKSGK
jgi:hypothetical protein